MSRKSSVALLAAIASLALTALGPTVSPAAGGSTRVYTNQSYVEDAMNRPDFAIEDVHKVFELVLSSLPQSVDVFPTENYYYFYFYYNGIKYAGNLRFDIEDRDDGIVHFNYFKDFTLWQRDEADFSARLGAKDGVIVKKEGSLAYSVSANGRTVMFRLNDLSRVKPPKDAVRSDETYIGPVFDESGLRFFLVFNPELKIFLYVLDETEPVADQFVPVPDSDRLKIGIRSGFAFYADRHAARQILVAVHQTNTSVNNYLDGPFDQLPDNFISGDVLQRAILAASPEMKGQIDRLGNSPDGETRYLIAPYMQYEDEAELQVIEECAAHESLPIYYNCFSFADSGPAEDDPAPPP